MKILGQILFVLAMVNFGVFVAVALTIGGDALNGFAEGGRYYLANHGRYTEVSKNVFIYSKWHFYSVFATHGLWLAVTWRTYPWRSWRLK